MGAVWDSHMSSHVKNMLPRKSRYISTQFLSQLHKDHLWFRYFKHLLNINFQEELILEIRDFLRFIYTGKKD